MLVVLVLVGGWVLLAPLVALAVGRMSRDRVPPEPPLRLEPEPAVEPLVLTDEAVVVTAHGLVNACSVVLGGVQNLQASWAEMTDEQRAAVLAAVETQATMIQNVLVDLTHGISDETRLALETLERPPARATEPA